MKIDLETDEILELVIDGTCEFSICGERNEEETMVLNTNAQISKELEKELKDKIKSIESGEAELVGKDEFLKDSPLGI